MWNLVVRATAAVALTALVSTSASAAIYGPQQQLPTATVESFKSNPSQLLQFYPNGGAGLIARVRDLAASDPTTLPLLIQLLKTLNPETQRGVIGGIATGLAQAARMASRTDQAFANEIQAAVAGSGVPSAVETYQASLGDAPIGAGGAGGGGAGGGGTGAGGPTGTSGFVFGGSNGGGASSFGARNYQTQATSPTTGSVGGTSNSVSSR
jgi:hypothetical protein